MFLVGGGILVHGIPALDHAVEALAEGAGRLPGVGGALHVVLLLLLNAATGIVAGAVVLGAVKGAQRLMRDAPA
jgi:predicted DNA repair protein MutK